RDGRDLLPALLARDAETGVGACSDCLELPLELSPRTQPIELQRAVVDRGQDSTFRLVHMRAVPELALHRKRLDVLERGAEIALPELELTQAGSVDDQPTAWQPDELTMRRGVTPGSVGGDLTCEHHFVIGQPIEQSRLADA